MRISIITITCRKDARLDQMARTLNAAAELCPQTEFEWVVVDEKLWAHDPGVDLLARRRSLAAPELYVLHLPPKPSIWRGPWRRTARDLPDPNGARNTGLALCTGEYVVFLDDNCLVTERWLEGVCEIAKMEAGYRGFVDYAVPKLAPFIPRDGAIRETRQIDIPFRVTASQCSGIFGAPMGAFRKIRSMDESYAGEMKWEDLDAVIRLERTGLPFYSAGRGTVIHVQHELGEVCDDERLYAGKQNAKRWERVLADKDRTWPARAHPTLYELRVKLAPYSENDHSPKNGSHGGNGAAGGNGATGGTPIVPPGGGGASAGGNCFLPNYSADFGLSSEIAWR